MAGNVALYQFQHGALPFGNFTDILRAETIDAGTAKCLSARMQYLVGALAQVNGVAYVREHERVH